MQMKAITIYQPWASLVAVGAKRFETRGWYTHYRGPIAIHAGTKDCVDIMSSAQISAVIRAFAGTRHEVRHNRGIGGYDYIYPYGAVIATAELVGCHKIIAAHNGAVGIHIHDKGFEDFHEIRGDELLFGDWTPGRYAWELTNVQLLDTPIPCKGKQGLWNVELGVTP